MLCLLSFRATLTSPVTFRASSCDPSTTYNPNSTTGSIYGTHLNFTLNTLSSNASRTDNNGFYKISTGDDPSNTVYGLFLCRGDVNTDVCEECVANASIQVFKDCLNRKVAMVLYDECLLYFSNQPIFPDVDRFHSYLIMWNPHNISEPDRNNFIMVLGKLVYNAVDQAANSTRGKNVAVQDDDYSSDRLYTLVQCTPDLSGDECKKCLNRAIRNLDVANLPIAGNDTRGGRIVFPICNIRYEFYRFYNTVSSPPSPPPPNSPGGPPPSSTKGKGRSVSQAALIDISLIGVAIVLLIIAMVFLKRRSRRSYVAMGLIPTGKVY
ncbi:putative cysteine-rich receptor-like protein kinase 9 [Coffea arabica]|uniref:Cysteine-rich receptor-like protein kinase 9 n=1 Tax=Coffea arabica TaxID=13443 RepID=A0ABM4UES5_COFAR